MILRRLGNKKKFAKMIQKYFPRHNIYIEPFFGAGGMFFSKPKAKFNILNDIDDDVYNLFRVIVERKDEFMEMFRAMPIHETLFKNWKKNTETDPVKKAVRFVLLSNYSSYGKMNTLKFDAVNVKKEVYKNIDHTIDYLQGVMFMNSDFREMFSKISSRVFENKKTVFVYCDPPYIKTANNYSNSFTLQDLEDLFEILNGLGVKFAVSEFKGDEVVDLAKKFNLYVNYIKTRHNIKNIRTEILITNYLNLNKDIEITV